MTATIETPTVPIDGDEYVVATEKSGLVRVEHASQGVLTIDPRQTEFNDLQRVALKAMGIETEGDDAVPVPNVLMFLHQCQAMLLDPYLKQAYLITHGKIKTGNNGQRYDNRKFTFVVGIDGFRRRGALAGGDDYSGVTAPEWASEDEKWHTMWSRKWAAEDAEWGQPLAARVGIRKRHDPDRPTYGVAMWDEFVPLVDEYLPVLDKNGRQVWEGNKPKSTATGRKIPTDMWIKMPANQTSKCAEAAAWRKSYPDTFSGVYAPEEMDRTRVEYEEARRRQADEDAAARARRAIGVSQARVPKGQPRAAERAEQARQDPPPGEPLVGTVVEREPADTPLPKRHRTVKVDPVPVADTVPETEEHLRATPLGEEHTAAALRDEIAAIARYLDKPLAEIVERKEKTFGKPYTDWTVDLLVRYLCDGRYSARALVQQRQEQRANDDEEGAGEALAAYRLVPYGMPVLDLTAIGLPTD